MNKYEIAMDRMRLVLSQTDLSRIKRTEASVIQIDIHGMTCREAKRFLNNVLNLLLEPMTVRVIHGCNRGTALQAMVRQDFSNSHIKAINLDIRNNGVTYLLVA